MACKMCGKARIADSRTVTMANNSEQVTSQPCDVIVLCLSRATRSRKCSMRRYVHPAAAAAAAALATCSLRTKQLYSVTVRCDSSNHAAIAENGIGRTHLQCLCCNCPQLEPVQMPQILPPQHRWVWRSDAAHSWRPYIWRLHRRCTQVRYT